MIKRAIWCFSFLFSLQRLYLSLPDVKALYKIKALFLFLGKNNNAGSMYLMALCIPWTIAVAQLHQMLAFSRPSPEWIGSMQCRIELSGGGYKYIPPSTTIK